MTNDAHRPMPPERIGRAGWFCVFMVAVPVVAWRLGRPSLHIDETASWYTAAGDWARFWEQCRRGEDGGGFTYALLLKLWTARMGDVESLIRLPSVVFHLTFVAVLMKVGCALGARRGAVASGLIAAIHPVCVDHARQARPYALLLLLTALTLFGVIRVLEERRGSGRFALLIASWLAVLTHSFGVFVVLGAAAALALSRSGTGDGDPICSRRRWREILPLASALIPWSVWTLYRASFIRDQLEDFWGRADHAEQLQAVARSILIHPAVGGAFVIVAAIFGLLRPFSSRSRAEIASLFVIAVCVGLGPFLATALASGNHHFYTPRYFHALLPPLILLVGTGLARFPAIGLWLILGISVVFYAVRQENAYDFGHPTGVDAREVGRYLREETTSTDRIFTTPWNHQLLLEYYGVEAELITVKESELQTRAAPMIAREPDHGYWLVMFNWFDAPGLVKYFANSEVVRFHRVAVVCLQRDPTRK